MSQSSDQSATSHEPNNEEIPPAKLHTPAGQPCPVCVSDLQDTPDGDAALVSGFVGGAQAAILGVDPAIGRLASLAQVDPSFTTAAQRTSGAIYAHLLGSVLVRSLCPHHAEKAVGMSAIRIEVKPRS